MRAGVPRPAAVASAALWVSAPLLAFAVAGCVHRDALERDAPSAVRAPPLPSASRAARRPALPVTGLDAARAAAVARCLGEHDVAAHFGDMLTRYGHQGRLSDDALAAHRQLSAEVSARATAVATCVMAAGFSDPGALTPPHLAKATTLMAAKLEADAARWALPAHAARPRALLRRVVAALGVDGARGLAAADALPAAGLVLRDVAVLGPAPEPIVAANGRKVGVRWPLVLSYGVAGDRRCWQRFASFFEGAQTGLRVAPQWRRAPCP